MVPQACHVTSHHHGGYPSILELILVFLAAWAGVPLVLLVFVCSIRGWTENGDHPNDLKALGTEIKEGKEGHAPGLRLTMEET